jgi:hypothetical protein
MENQEGMRMEGDGEDAVTSEPVTALAPVGVDKVSLFVGEPTAADRYVQAIRTFREMIPKATKPTDWVSFGDPKDPQKCQVYLQEYAASQISRLLQTKFGYNIIINKPNHLIYPDSPTPWGIEKTVDGVAHLEVIVQGSVDVQDIQTGKAEHIEPILGASSTTDPFFTKRYGDFKDPRSVPFGGLLKKAIANYKGNCFREIWGLKGFTLADLAKAGLDVSQVHDSMRRDAGHNAAATPEEKDAKAQLWDRILRAHDGKADEARKWLKSMTSYPAGTNKRTGKSYEANPGFDNIAQAYMTNRDGSENFTWKKIVEAVDKMEKARPEASEHAAQSAAGAESDASALYMKLKDEIEACTTPDQVIAAEKKVAMSRGLSSPQMRALSSIAQAKTDDLTSQTGGL